MFIKILQSYSNYRVTHLFNNSVCFKCNRYVVVSIKIRLLYRKLMVSLVLYTLYICYLFYQVDHFAFDAT